MDIDVAIDALQKYKKLGALEVLLARDFAPGANVMFNYIPTPKGTQQIAWVCEVADDFTTKAQEPRTKIVLKKDLQGLDVNGRTCEACNSHMYGHEWVAMDQNGFVEFCEHSVALTINAG